MQIFCDNQRHLVCVPYTRENLHRMAAHLGIKRCWFHNHPRHPHYDIPKRRVAEIQAMHPFVQLVSTRKIARITSGGLIEDTQ